MDILYKLLHLEKIYKDEIDKDVDDYLNFLTKKISWFILNPTGEFYCRDYYKKASRMRPWKSKYIKLKYFYHWKFPPKYKDSEIPEIPINEETKMLASGKIITENEFGKDRIKTLLKRGFLQKIEYEDMEKHDSVYESTGISLKYYRGIDESTLAGYQTDNLNVFNLSGEDIIIDVEELTSKMKVLLFKQKDLHNLFLSTEKSNKGNLAKSKLLNGLHTSSVLLKSGEFASVSAVVIFDGINIPREVFRLFFKGENIIEKTILLPAKSEY